MVTWWRFCKMVTGGRVLDVRVLGLMVIRGWCVKIMALEERILMRRIRIIRKMIRMIAMIMMILMMIMITLMIMITIIVIITISLRIS